ncbi:tyrosine-type recombinase/integrase [Lysinibacillus parviboronicapiens]|uniref:tyrosine-type recombinase/integrase n=1 Tax=Lysinibacillus parviboronicapiens TaxID=436516 RepID=UPI0006D18826
MTACKQWSNIVKQHNLPSITFHSLRHTFASYMLSKIINIKVFQEQLGHVIIHETHNKYSHVAQEQKEEARFEILKIKNTQQAPIFSVTH